MLKILIVEDELLIRLGLKTALNWEKYGYTITGEASNGQDAIEMVKKCVPDIVLTDIQMPKMDGMELIAALQKDYTEIRFIILSNYDSFEYAKEAIRLGVSRYILKSEINEQTLLSALGGVDLHRTGGGKPMPDPAMRQDYLKKLLNRTNVNRCVQYSKMLPPEEGLFPTGSYFVVKYACNISSLLEKSIDMLSKVLTELMEAAYPGIVCHSITHKAFHYFTGIVGAAPGEIELKALFCEKSRMIEKKLQQYYPLTLYGGVSTVKQSGDIPRLLYEAELARQQCFFTGEKTVVFCGEAEPKQVLPVHVSGRRISELLRTRDAASLAGYIHEVFESVRICRAMRLLEQVFVEFIVIAKNYCEEENILQSGALSSKWDYSVWEDLSHIKLAEDYIWEMYALVLEAADSADSRYSSNVQKCMQYIRQNYAASMSLEDAAQYVAVSKSYLSMLFKQETGVNFVSYLNRFRIEKSKELLEDTNFKIYEIALQVGFESPYYFSKLFKEIAGIGCKEYKDTHCKKG